MLAISEINVEIKIESNVPSTKKHNPNFLEGLARNFESKV